MQVDLFDESLSFLEGTIIGKDRVDTANDAITDSLREKGREGRIVCSAGKVVGSVR